MRIVGAGVIGIAALVAIVPSATALGQASGDDPLTACASIASRSARLACYDDAERRRRPAAPPREIATRPEPAKRTRAAADREPTAVARGFGAEQVRDRRPKAQRPKEITNTSAQVASVSDNGVGHWRIALSDGAVWQMTQADPYFLPPERGQTVRIRKGSLGGYLLDVGRQSSVMVTRIR